MGATIIDIGGAGFFAWPFFLQGRWNALFFHLRIGCISTMPCGHLFTLPIFPTKLFIKKNPLAPPQTVDYFHRADYQIPEIVHSLSAPRWKPERSLTCLENGKVKEVRQRALEHTWGWGQLQQRLLGCHNGSCDVRQTIPRSAEYSQ